MARACGHPSVILLLDGDGDRDSLRAWFQGSRFCLLEADDVMDAMDELTDFTTRRRPDVVMVPLDPASDEASVSQLVRHRSDNGALSVISLSGRSATGASGGMIDELEARLDTLIPRATKAAYN